MRPARALLPLLPPTVLLALAAAGCGGAEPRPSAPVTSSAGSARNGPDSGSAATEALDPAMQGGDVPDAAPTTLTQAVEIIATTARGIVPPVSAPVVRTIDGTTCRLRAGRGGPSCRVVVPIATTGYCPPQSGTEVVTVALLDRRAAPRCGDAASATPSTAPEPARLANGQVTLAGNALRCLGLEAGVACVSRDHRAGFFLSLDGYRVLG